jgi:proteic killer suppression protein
MIRTFECNETKKIFLGGTSTKFPQTIQRTAYRKLLTVNAAKVLKDLSVPPNNRLHALREDRKGQHSISINDQFRICFKWTAEGPEGVEITDYH